MSKRIISVSLNETSGVFVNMIQIPAGSFMMGSPPNEAGRYADEDPQHRVNISEFYLGQTPITQAQWRTVADLPQIDIKLDPDPSMFKGDNKPVDQVSWFEAMEFCSRLNKHTDYPGTFTLPSEAQWEYACRAGTTTRFHFGDTITNDQVNFDSFHEHMKTTPIGRKQNTPVDMFPANVWGLYDMHGNVLEWCSDVWHDNYEGAPNDGSAWLNKKEEEKKKRRRPIPNHYRVMRGGCSHDLMLHCRSAVRHCESPSISNSSLLGFRVCYLP
jgi:formylglycine-generating enzyme required for sulfatase activity